MEPLLEETLCERVIAWVRANGNGAGGEISPDTDLIAAGLLDSFGFVELIMYVEQETGCQIDWSDADPEQFTIIKVLCEFALLSAAPNGDSA